MPKTTPPMPNSSSRWGSGSDRRGLGLRARRDERAAEVAVPALVFEALTKAGGIQSDTSIHLFFDQALTAFRFIFRVNGQPAWSSTITRQNGSSNELSWAVALQAR